MNRRDFLARISITAALLHAERAPAALTPSAVEPACSLSGHLACSGTKLNESAAKAAGLSPDYTFDRFIEGRVNHHARAVAFSFDSNPYSIRHPLCIYGARGLGKTHLMQAIGNKVLSQDSHARVKYVNAFDFRGHLHQAHKNLAVDRFRKIFDSLDVLLLDDVQYVNCKPGTQAELLRTLDKLAERNSLIVMTAECLPQEWPNKLGMVAMNSDLMSRIHAGQPVELYSPDLELRMNCLMAKAEQEGLAVGNDVVRYVAKRTGSKNMRVLEGALNSVVAYSLFHGKDISLAVARQALSGIG